MVNKQEKREYIYVHEFEGTTGEAGSRFHPVIGIYQSSRLEHMFSVHLYCLGCMEEPKGVILAASGS